MSEGIETTEVVEPWLFAVLSGDEQLMALVDGNLWNTTEATESRPDAWLEYAYVSSRDILSVGGGRVQVDAIYQVKAVVRSASYDPATTIASRATRVLEQGSTVSTPAGDLTCTRESIIQYPELQDGTSFRHLGGTYRIRANSSS